MKRQPRPLALTVRGKNRVVAYACRVCHVVALKERDARECCGKQCRCGTTIRTYQSECLSCTAESAHERIREREEREMAEATKVELADYGGTHLSDGGEYYVATTEADDDGVREQAMEYEGRRFLWGCRTERPSLDLGREIQEHVLEGFHEDAFEQVDTIALERAQAEVDKALAPVVSYYADKTVMVLLPEAEER